MRLPQIFALVMVAVSFSAQGQNMLPNGFVYLSQACPELIIAASYAGTDNFTGSVVDGYRRHEAIFSERGARALCKVQEEVSKQGLSLKIFDAYRPTKAVRFFQAWARLPETDSARKIKFYPGYTRRELFELGYIAERSSHSRGSAVDLTLVNSNGTELDMGTIFDFFHERSHTNSPAISAHHRRNRELLKSVMEKHGFKNFAKEWWHFSLVTEAFPGQSFDFDVE